MLSVVAFAAAILFGLRQSISVVHRRILPKPMPASRQKVRFCQTIAPSNLAAATAQVAESVTVAEGVIRAASPAPPDPKLRLPAVVEAPSASVWLSQNPSMLCEADKVAAFARISDGQKNSRGRERPWPEDRPAARDVVHPQALRAEIMVQGGGSSCMICKNLRSIAVQPRYLHELQQMNHTAIIAIGSHCDLAPHFYAALVRLRV